MKKYFNMSKVFIVAAIAVFAAINSIEIAHAPTFDEDYVIRPIIAEANAEDTNEFVERALKVSEGYDFVEYISTSENEVVYIVEDDNGFQYKVAYTEENGNPVSGITLYQISQS